MIHSLYVAPEINKRDFPVTIITTIGVLVVTCFGTIIGGSFLVASMDEVVGDVTRGIAIVLLIVFLGYTLLLIREAKRNPVDDEGLVEGEPVVAGNAPLKESLAKSILLMIIGIVLVVTGGQAVVNSAEEIARIFGMSETLIGVTIVAAGTSLPELMTSVVAAKKGETGIAVGNVVGSNKFNLLFILGFGAVIHPISVNMASLWEMAILVFVSGMTYYFGLTREGIICDELISDFL